MLFQNSFGPQSLSTQSWSATLPADHTRHWLTRLTNASGPELDSLNRTLVAGLLLEVMLENPRVAGEPGSRGQKLKACLGTTLASQLAGHISLASFHRMAHGMDHWFEIMYPLLANAGLAGSDTAAPVPLPDTTKSCAIREDLFNQCLESIPGLLPKRRHRKLNPEKLRSFLEGTGGGWFRLRDFEEHFLVERKTAWEYVQKLLQAGLLVHNQGHSSAVRYQVAPRFLKPAWASSGSRPESSCTDTRHLHPDWHTQFRL